MDSDQEVAQLATNLVKWRCSEFIGESGREKIVGVDSWTNADCGKEGARSYDNPSESQKNRHLKMHKIKYARICEKMTNKNEIIK